MKLHVLFLISALQLSVIGAEKINARHHHFHAKRQLSSSSRASSPAAPPVTPPPPAPTTSNPSPTPPAPPAPSPPGTTPTPVAPSPSLSSTGISSTGISSTGSSSKNATTSVNTIPPLATYTGVPPLANISVGMATRPIPLVTAVFTPGATPPISGAPVLPTALSLGTWPAQDKVPPTDSAEVQIWMQELDGFDIPALSTTINGSCLLDPGNAANAASRGWWTCGGYTRDTDITTCPDKYTWGVSFDDGPSPYTQYVLNYLAQKDLSATFFVVGSRVIERPNVLIEEYMAGHEISVHTWSHSPLTSLTTEQIVAELGWTRKAIHAVLGVTPTTMRPPYGDIDDRVRAISLAMGMVPIMWTNSPTGGKFDTNDWRVAGGLVNSTDSFNIFQSILGNATLLDTGFIVLQHDLYEISVDLAVGYTLDAALNHEPKFTLEAIGECQKFPPGNLYLETNANTTFPFRNSSSGGVDVSGDGSGVTKSGDGGLTAANNKSAGFTNSVPFLTSVTTVVVAAMSMLL